MNRELNAKLQKMKRDYCFEAATATGEGGGSVEFRHLVQKDYEENPKDWAPFYAGMLDKAASTIWVTDLKPPRRFFEGGASALVRSL